MHVHPPDDLEAQVIAATLRRRLFDEQPRALTVGRYCMLRKIGAGSHGSVWTAYDDHLDRKVALKVLHPDPAFDREQAHARLAREAKAIARIKHPNVVAVYDVGTHRDAVFVVMELVRGVPLHDWARDESWEEVVDAFVSLARGLAAAHAVGVIHRDFKPVNVVVDGAGTPYVLDFGLARAPLDTPRVATSSYEDALRRKAHKDEVPLTAPGTILGSPAYMSPEQHRGHFADARCDQFSFCVSLFEMLYGVLPFSGSSSLDLSVAIARGETAAIPTDTEVPAAVHEVIRRGMASAPGDRFPSMTAVADALAEAKCRCPREAARRRWWVAGILALLVLAAAVLTCAAWAPGGLRAGSVVASVVELAGSRGGGRSSGRKRVVGLGVGRDHRRRVPARAVW